ncbi:transmembrane protein 65 isoform X2 [Lingula anatina]|uniref:Transmembrane protein 65 isoform X2 n=1 Tax=Lingula anatina TaxID=7574 RepID=A0A1S3K464_LINAN|nr:transmembrane protein 65 isoform X2 [Lingula anatina]|eukprot:XP_013417204.1 transmembrane protein 65 isoform X2 [Lingula anatina]
MASRAAKVASRTLNYVHTKKCRSHTFHSGLLLRNISPVSSQNLRRVHWDVRTTAGAKDFIYTLDNEEREQLLLELQRFEEARKSPGERYSVPKKTKTTEVYESASPVPSWSQLRKVALYNGLPFIGFGILDNVIMITAGEYIDATFGAMLGISTMAAAALGNMVSDVAGVGTAGIVENAVSKLGVKPPNITPSQADHRSTRIASALGRAIGIAFGCLLGMFPLFLLHQEGIFISKDEKTESENTESEKS